MTVSDLDVKQIYVGDDSTTTFAIPFAYNPTTKNDVTKVYVRENYRYIKTLNVDAFNSKFIVSHAFLPQNTKVHVFSSGTLPQGLVKNYTYYVIYLDDTHFQLAESLDKAKSGDFIKLQDRGSGIITIQPVVPSEILLTENLDYEIIGENVEFFTAPTIGTEIIVIRKTPPTQEVDYIETTPWKPIIVEEEFDKLTMLIQELNEMIRRALKVSLSYKGDFNLEVPKPEAGKVLGWGSDGISLENLYYDPKFIPDKATLQEAQAGINNEHYMTPYLTLQALLANPHPDINTLRGIIASANQIIDLLNQRIHDLENNVQVGEYFSLVTYNDLDGDISDIVGLTTYDTFYTTLGQMLTYDKII